MELLLLRACFPNNTVAQLYMKDQLLCVYMGFNELQGWTPISRLPDGRYTLSLPRDGKEEYSLQLITPQSRKPLFMDLRNQQQEQLQGYTEAPLYLSFAGKSEQITDPAKRNIHKVVEAIEEGRKVYITIRSQDHA